MRDNVIEVINLSKRFDDKLALREVNLIIPTNKIVGLLGPNGAGKTTLIRILTRILIPEEGKVYINQTPLDKINVKRIGYLPEERGLYKKMKVGEQAIYFATIKGIDKVEAKKRLKEWFEKLEIYDWWNKTVESLSKGMQQKIQFIISVIHQPDLLILDEPFSGLDPINREILGNQILELNRAGMTIVLSTHDMNSVEQFCSEVVLIDKGEVLLEGKVDEIKQTKKSYLYEFQFNKNEELFLEKCNQLNAEIVSLEKKDKNFCVIAKFRNEQAPVLLLSNVLQQINLTSFREILPSMHDIFVESINRKDNIN